MIRQRKEALVFAAITANQSFAQATDSADPDLEVNPDSSDSFFWAVIMTLIVVALIASLVYCLYNRKRSYELEPSKAQ